MLQPGSIEIICGGMFAGKTEELIRRLKRARIARQTVLAFKPQLDNRYSATDIASHDQDYQEAIVINQAAEILSHIQYGVSVVGIDEIHFFDKGIVAICEKLANQGIRVIAAGLDQNFKGEPFANTAALMAKAETVDKVHAVCVSCGERACKSWRKSQEQTEIVVGAAEQYEAVCRRCFQNKLISRLSEKN